MGNVCTKFEESLPEINTVSSNKESISNSIVSKGSNLYCIGRNDRGQLGVGHQKYITELTQSTKLFDIANIHCGNCFTIFTTNKGEYYAVGRNDKGQCAVNSKHEDIIQSIAVDYFETNQVKVQKVFSNCNGNALFWVNDHKVYANGWNHNYQLGLSDKKNKRKPTLLPMLNAQYIKDIQNGERHTILLGKYGSVYSAGNTQWLGMFKHVCTLDTDECLHCAGNKEYLEKYSKYRKGQWNVIHCLKNIKIAQIQCGSHYSLFLTMEGVVYSGGHNHHGELGRGRDKTCPQSGELITIVPKIIQKIQYFIDNSIVIEHIQSGLFHNLALDSKGIVYCWGHNGYGQLGVGRVKERWIAKEVITAKGDKIMRKSPTSDVYIPRAVQSVKGEVIMEIKCGTFHSCFQTQSGQYWMFGSNDYNEVTLFFELITTRPKIWKPYYINDKYKEMTNGRDIKDIFLGYQCTFIISEHKQV